MGIDPDRLTIIIHQLVTLKRGQQILRASKRAGEVITLQELLDEVGTDPCRYFFLARSPDSQMEFDLELAKKSSNENPVFYVQYAHARVASILNLAAENGIDHSDGDVSASHRPGGARAHTQDTGAAGAHRVNGREAGAAPPAPLLAGPGDGVPLVLPAVPRRVHRSRRRGHHEGAPQAGPSVRDRAAQDAVADGNGSAGEDVALFAPAPATRAPGSRQAGPLWKLSVMRTCPGTIGVHQVDVVVPVSPVRHEHDLSAHPPSRQGTCRPRN